eukprot:11256928-Ditylum_brightwellii.AAC.1
MHRLWVQGQPWLLPPRLWDSRAKKAMGSACARQKTVTGQLKNWNVLQHEFWHCYMKHHLVFQAVLVVEQKKLQSGRPVFQVDHFEDQACFWD